MREKKVTYLLGAGASYEAVPVANELAKTMQEWVNGPASGMPVEVREHPYFEPFVKNIREVSNAAIREGGIDAYAKILWHSPHPQDADKLRALKATLSCWLLARQRGGKIDKRYVHFLGALAQRGSDGSIKFNPRVNIITWNYDLQIELVSTFRLNIPEEQVVNVLCAPPPNSGQNIHIDPDKFFLARLNGFAGAHRLGNAHDKGGEFQRLLGLVLRKDSFQSMIEILDLFGKYCNASDLIPAIDFAWEPQSMWSEYLEEDVSTSLKQTTHLIIIGYSFPAFNSGIDKKLLSQMAPQKIIIQDPNAPEVAERLFDLIPEWELKTVSRRTRCDSFEVLNTL